MGTTKNCSLRHSNVMANPNSAQIQRTKEKNIEEGGEEFIGAVLNKAEFAV